MILVMATKPSVFSSCSSSSSSSGSPLKPHFKCDVQSFSSRVAFPVIGPNSATSMSSTVSRIANARMHADFTSVPGLAMTTTSPPSPPSLLRQTCAFPKPGNAAFSAAATSLAAEGAVSMDRCCTSGWTMGSSEAPPIIQLSRRPLPPASSREEHGSKRCKVGTPAMTAWSTKPSSRPHSPKVFPASNTCTPWSNDDVSVPFFKCACRRFTTSPTVHEASAWIDASGSPEVITTFSVSGLAGLRFAPAPSSPIPAGVSAIVAGGANCCVLEQ
mmetsp:Transcript_137220/g.382775  ORF Transcript_137220/g.382775 Transcript_137220/m.382775 type:complete len:272 (-) Transcript_137220:8-823(-)